MTSREVCEWSEARLAKAGVLCSEQGRYLRHGGCVRMSEYRCWRLWPTAVDYALLGHSGIHSLTYLPVEALLL